jgi:hypothetical protein
MWKKNPNRSPSWPEFYTYAQILESRITDTRLFAKMPTIKLLEAVSLFSLFLQ